MSNIENFKINKRKEVVYIRQSWMEENGISNLPEKIKTLFKDKNYQIQLTIF